MLLSDIEIETKRSNKIFVTDNFVGQKTKAS